MQKPEVFYLMSHVVIALAVIIGYVYTLAIGHQDETLRMAVFAIIGYWFGLAGGTVKKAVTGQSQPNQPENNPPNDPNNKGGQS